MRPARVIIERILWAASTLGILVMVAARYGLTARSMRWSAVVVAMGTALITLTAGTRWGSFAKWTALATASQACALHLLAVGSANHLQLFHPWGTLLGISRVWIIGLVVLQLIIVLRAAVRLWRDQIISIWKAVPAGRAALFFSLIAFSAVIAARETIQAVVQAGPLTAFADEFLRTLLSLGVLLATGVTLLLAAASFPNDVWEKIGRAWEANRRSWLPWACAIWVFAVCASASAFVFDRMPHIPDESSYLFQAKYYAAGKLWLPEPPEPEAFLCTMTIYDRDRWYGVQLPGWPLVLAIGARFGMHWLVNPILGALAILLGHVLVRRLYDRATADSTILLLSFSPWLLYMSSTLMGHSVSLIYFLAGMLGVESARNRGSLAGALLAGLFFGLLGATRPLEGVATAAFAGLWWLSADWKSLRLSALALTNAVGLAVTFVHLAYNKAVTGDAFLLPFEQMMDKLGFPGRNRVGFGPDVGTFGWTHLDPLPGHGLPDVIVNANQNFYMINFELFGWACGSLLFVFLLASARRFRLDLVPWGVILSIAVGMSFYWFGGGPDLCARYWYLMIVPLALLTVRGAQWLAEVHLPGHGRFLMEKVWLFVALATLAGFVNIMPWRALDKFRGYRGVSGQVRRLDAQYHFGKSLVFLRGELPELPWRSSIFTSGFALNPLTYERSEPGTIYVRDLGEASRERLRAYYYDRSSWIVVDPTVTGKQFQLLEGPIRPFQEKPSGKESQP